MSLPSSLRSFRHRNYRLFFGGQLISVIGTWMQAVAQSWLIYRLSHSAFLLGMTGFVGQIPGFVAAPLGGFVADRYNRHRVLVGTQVSAMILAFILAALTLTNHVRVWEIMVLAGMLGVVNAFDIPARQAFVVEMVGKQDLVNAIALNSSMMNGARTLGPALAGVLVALMGEGWCFFANAVSYIAVILGLMMMELPPRERAPRVESPVAHVLEGYRYVLKTAPIRNLLTLLGLVSLMGVPYSVLMPIFADEILKGGASALGVLMAASGAGALLGALALTFRKGIRGLGRWIAIATSSFGASLIIFAYCRNYRAAVVVLVLVGFTMMVQMASTNTLLQSMVQDRLRGRVMAVYSMMFLGMVPFGSLLAGSMAKPLGAPFTVAIGGVACIIGGLVFWKKLPEFREGARELVLSSGHAALGS